jgi:hypothetical protein
MDWIDEERCAEAKVQPGPGVNVFFVMIHGTQLDL